MALGTEYIIKYLSDISGAVKGANELQILNAKVASTIGADYANATRIIGTDFAKISTKPITINGKEAVQQVQQIGTVFETVSGKFRTFTQAITTVDGQIINMTGSLKDTTGQFSKTAVESEKSSKNFKDMGQNIATLAGRALLTIPIWMALRTAVMDTLSIFTDGFKNLVNESLALDKVKKSLQGTAETITTNFETMKKETQSLAIETGISHEKIIATFQKFASVGLDFATALTATNAVTKLSVITQSDASASAEGFSHALTVLIDSTASAADKQKQVNDIMALTSELWKTNGFNVDEFTGSLEKFAITAKSVNFTTNETLTLLATLSKSGLGSAGNLLRNSIGQLLVNIDKLAGDLGVKVNPALDDTFSILMKVLEQLNGLQKINDLKGLEQARTALKDIFGGTRSAVPITALASLYDTLKQNISLIPDINKFNNSFKESEGVLGNVVARFHAVNTEIGKSFLTGLIGGEDFTHTLNKIDELLTKIQANSETFGKVIQGTFNIPKGAENLLSAVPLTLSAKLDPEFATKIQDQIIQALHGKSSKLDLALLFNTLLEAQTLKLNLGISDKDMNVAIANIRQQLLSVRTITEDTTKETQKQVGIQKHVVDVMLKKQDFIKLENFAKKELSALGLSEVEVEKRILDLRTASKQFSDTDLALQKELVTHLQIIEEIELKRSRAKGLIDNQLELLRLQGATNLQVVQQRIELERMFGLNQTRADLLRNEIELNKEITKEKMNQNKVSSVSLKLFEIAQKFGVGTATKVANFVSGKLPLETFESGHGLSDLMPILKEFFSAEVEQRKAQEFFFKGLGEGIPIPERVAIQNVPPIDLRSIKLPDINTQVGQINVDIKKMFKEEDTAKQIIDSLLEAIRNNSSIEDAINEKIDNF